MIERLRDTLAVGKLGYAIGEWLYQLYWFRPIRAILSWNGDEVDRELEDALCSGLSYYGVDTYRSGRLSPTAIRAGIAELQADCGLVVTTSPESPGTVQISIFTDTGTALPEVRERTIEQLITRQPEIVPKPPLDRSRSYLPSPIG